MAVGQEASQMATVIRLRTPRGGANIMIHARGFDPKTAAHAADEAADLLTQAASNTDAGDITNIIQGSPLVVGSVLVSQGRYRVLYRLMGQLIALVVTPCQTNALTAVDVLEKLVRVMTLDLHSVELSIEKFTRRYAEVYMGASALLADSGAISAAQALAEGHAALESMYQGMAAKRAEPSQGGAAPGKEGAEPVPGSQAGTVRSRRRTLASQAQLPQQFGFPTANLRATSAFAVDGGAAPKAALPFTAKHQLAVMPEDDMFGALKAAVKDAGPLDDDPLSLLGPPVAAKKDGPKKGEDPFAFVEAALGSDKKKGPEGPPPPPNPTNPLLRLVETWRAEVKGSMVVKAGHMGEVQCLPELNSTTVPVIGFALQYNPPAAHTEAGIQAVHDGLRTARAMQSVVKAGWPPGYQPAAGLSETGGEEELEGFTAEVASCRGLLSPVIMRYGIPAGRGPVSQPVRVRLDTSLWPLPSGHETGVLLGVQLQLDAQLRASIASLEIKLHIPSLYDLPARARPGGCTMDGSRRILKWTLPPPPVDPLAPVFLTTTDTVTLDQVCSQPVGFSAAFQVSGSVAAAKGVLRTVMAEIDLKGKPGTTLSGVLLRQHGFLGNREQAALGSCSWQSKVIARCNV